MYIQIVSFFLNEYIGEIEWIEDQIIVINGKNQFQKRYYSQTSKKNYWKCKWIPQVSDSIL